MPDLRVDLFGEDAAHEDCGRALIYRCADLEGVKVDVHPVSVRFGIGRLKHELRAYQAAATKGLLRLPDLLVVLIDANRIGTAARRREVRDVISPQAVPHVAVGTPDPYVEAWLLADAPSFAQRFGQQPQHGGRGGRDALKNVLVDALEAAGEIVLQGGYEFSQEILEVMDLGRAGRAEPSLGSFVDEVRRELRRLGQERNA